MTITLIFIFPVQQILQRAFRHFPSPGSTNNTDTLQAPYYSEMCDSCLAFGWTDSNHYCFPYEAGCIAITVLIRCQGQLTLPKTFEDCRFTRTDYDDGKKLASYRQYSKHNIPFFHSLFGSSLIYMRMSFTLCENIARNADICNHRGKCCVCNSLSHPE